VQRDPACYCAAQGATVAGIFSNKTTPVYACD